MWNKWIPVFFAVAAVGINVNYHYDGHYALPDLVKTPGAVRTVNKQLVCSENTKRFRDTTLAMKKQACGQYGILKCSGGDYEIDHLIPLELGGADADANLWPQPAPDFHYKDKLEDKLHELVCKNVVSLADAQYEIKHSWTVSYRKRIGALP